MKIMSLNALGGRAGKDLFLSFLKEHEDTDVFCFQEVWNGGEAMAGAVAGKVVLTGIMHSMLEDLQATLPNHTIFFRPVIREEYGIAMAVKNTYRILEEGEKFIYLHKGFEPEGDLGNHARNMQWVTLETESGVKTVCNVHGLWDAALSGRDDSPSRLEQSNLILEVTSGFTNPFVVIGDLNLTLETESVKLLERAGLRNLIREYGITGTRSKSYTKPDAYADYAFVSNGVEVRDFKTLPVEVSDHVPLVLEIA